MTQRASWWRSRWFIVPVSMATIVLGWNLYAAAHAGGIVEGRVVDAAGRGVAGATVVLYERSFILNIEKQRMQAGADGGFRFEGNASHAVQLQAEVAGVRSARLTVRLWFRAQDHHMGTPLRLPIGAT